MNQRITLMFVIGICIFASVLISFWLFSRTAYDKPANERDCSPREIDLEQLILNRQINPVKTVLSNDLKTIASFRGLFYPQLLAGEKMKEKGLKRIAIPLELISIEYDNKLNSLQMRFDCLYSKQGVLDKRNEQPKLNMTLLFNTEPTNEYSVRKMTIDFANISSWGLVSSIFKKSGRASCDIGSFDLRRFTTNKKNHYSCTKLDELICQFSDGTEYLKTMATIIFIEFAFEIDRDLSVNNVGNKYTRPRQSCLQKLTPLSKGFDEVEEEKDKSLFDYFVAAL